MHPEIQVIHFGTELIHPPQVQEEERLREFYHAISKIKYCGCDYREFKLLPSGAEMVTDIGRVHSVCRISDDRIHISEDWTSLSAEEFVARVREIIKVYFEIFNMRLFVFQTSAIRSLLTPTNCSDARVFLAEWVCRLDGAQEIFPSFENRPVQMFGIRLMFPAVKEENRRFSIRIESFNQDPHRVFVECISDYEGPPITEGQIDIVEQNIERALQFSRKNVLGFLSRYDVKKHEE
ncbi:MAG: hypothetical protein N2234_07720 [Planctomycetota bacterium]|nr:hypothetical protein [Planctomycetota bacterium]